MDDPEVKAERLLWEILPADLYFQFARHGHFKIKIGRRFYYFFRDSKTQSMDENRLVLSYCIHLSKKTPDADRIAAEYLLLTNNEAEYLRTANATVVSGAEPARRREWLRSVEMGAQILVLALVGIMGGIFAVKVAEIAHEGYDVPDMPAIEAHGLRSSCGMLRFGNTTYPHSGDIGDWIRRDGAEWRCTAYGWTPKAIAEAPLNRDFKYTAESVGVDQPVRSTLTFPDGRKYESSGEVWVQTASGAQPMSVIVLGSSSGIVVSAFADCERPDTRYARVDRHGNLCAGATVFAGYLTSSVSTVTSREYYVEAADGPTL